MGFGEAVRKVLSNYASFDGRAMRSEFWWFALFYLLVQLAGGVLDATLFPNSFGPIGALASLALLLPYLAVAARRLHDIDRTGWWQLIGFVPIIGAIVLIVFFVQRGTPGPNRFGAPPTDVTEVAA